MLRALGRVWLTGLSVLGLVAGLLGAAPPGAVGTHGDEDDIDFAPEYSACVGAATESFGFEDTVDIGAEDAINCLAHYGITTGRSETRYAPGETVLRWQMALFLARAAAAAGIELESPAGDQGFRDVGAVSAEARDAINGLAKANIMPGTSRTTFSPNSSVNRGSMAMLLDAFLAAATPGAGAFGGEIEKYSEVDADNFNVFDDISTVSLNTYNAIYRIYELGVTKGVGDHRFNPAGLVTRGQMASFITRAFAHTVARPAGVSIQGESDSVLGRSNVPLIVSVRDANFQPVADASVDVFRSTDPDDAFGDDGRCDSANVDRVGGIGQTACEVDVGDSTTDESGDLTDLSLDVDADVTVWAWTGDRGDKFDSDDTAAAQFTVGFSKAASQTLVTDSLEEGQSKSKFGEKVTVTIQIADEDDKAVADPGERVTVGRTTRAGGSTSSSTNTMTTDSDGKIVLEFTHTDPNTNTGDTARVTLELSVPSSGLPLRDADGNALTTKEFVWSDEASAPTTLTMSARTNFGVASDEGRGAGNSVSATLTDQFGDPVRGKRIRFFSDSFCTPRQGETTCSPTGIGVTESGGVTVSEDDGVRVLAGTHRFIRTTGRDGRANLSYTYDSNDGTIETIWAAYPLATAEVTVRGVADGSDGRPADDPDDLTVLTAERVYHFWAEDPSGVPFTGRILVKEPDNNQMVVFAEEKVMLVKYDANDHFDDLNGPATMAEFENLLAENADPAAAHLKVSTYQEDAGKVSAFALQTEWPGLDHPDGQAAGGPARFGQVVAVDNGVVVVGASSESVVEEMGSCLDSEADCSETDDATRANAGMVYIYPDGMGTAAVDIVKIKPPTITANGYFGWDVDISGDTVVVGTRDGELMKAYVYVRGSSGWPAAPTATFDSTASSPAHRGFGEGIAISSDGSIIAVTALFQFSAEVLIYEKPGAGGWVNDTDSTDNAKLVPESAAAGHNNERSLAISDDGSVVVWGGCNWGGTPASCRGAVMVHTEPVGGWSGSVTHAAVLYANGGAKARQVMGRTVAISDDGSTVLAGGSFLSGDNQPGVMYLFSKPDAGWATLNGDTTSSVILSASPGRARPNDALGYYVALSSDGMEVAGGRHYRQEGDFRGSVATFKRPSGGWANDSSPDDEFLGPFVNARLGWAVTYDKSTDDLYSAIRNETLVDSGRLLTVYKISR